MVMRSPLKDFRQRNNARISIAFVLFFNFNLILFFKHYFINGGTGD